MARNGTQDFPTVLKWSGQLGPGGFAKVKSSKRLMSAIGTKRASLFAPHMSAFGGKADMMGSDGDMI